MPSAPALSDHRRGAPQALPADRLSAGKCLGRVGVEIAAAAPALCRASAIRPTQGWRAGGFMACEKKA